MLTTVPIFMQLVIKTVVNVQSVALEALRSHPLPMCAPVSGPWLWDLEEE